MVRYADDFIVLCRSEQEAQAAMDLIAEWVEEAGLKLHPEKTRITTESLGFDFLGYHFRAGRRKPSRKSLKTFKATVRAKTKRMSGRSLMVIIEDLNQTLRGWYAYFKHSRWRIFKHLDQWIRIRLRTMLRKRHGGSRIGKGFDHMHWPNAYFARHGLFSLKGAYDRDRPSSRR